MHCLFRKQQLANVHAKDDLNLEHGKHKVLGRIASLSNKKQ